MGKCLMNFQSLSLRRNREVSIKNIDTVDYRIYINRMERYLELIGHEDSEKISTANLLIDYAIQDINTKIDELNQMDKNDYSTGYFYVITIKTDHIIHSVEQLHKAMKLKRPTNSNIKKFRLIRSLTLAHPLETTRYNEYDFGDENIKWCEDVRPYNRAFGDSETTDFRMIIREKGIKLSKELPVNIEEDIVQAARSALESLSGIFEYIDQRIVTKENDFRKLPIFDNSNTLFDKDYILQLINALKERYPSQVEVVEYQDDKIKEYSTLGKIRERLLLSFQNQNKDDKYEKYKVELRKILKSYSTYLQNMTLEEHLDELDNRSYQLLHPSIDRLMKLSGKDINYESSKIREYLDTDDSSFIALSQMRNFKESDLSNPEFALFKLYQLTEYLNPYFEIDKVVAIQYDVALYFLNEQEDIDTN